MEVSKTKYFPCNYMFKVSNRNSRARGEICSKLTMASSGIFIVTFEHISHLVLVFLLLTLSWVSTKRRPSKPVFFLARCTRARCALFCNFFYYKHLLSNEFLAGNSLMKMSDKITVNFRNFFVGVRRREMYFGKFFKVARAYLKSDIVQNVALNESHLLKNFVKN